MIWWWVIVGLLATAVWLLYLVMVSTSSAVAALRDIHYVQSKHLAELERIRITTSEIRGELPESRTHVP